MTRHSGPAAGVGIRSIPICESIRRIDHATLEVQQSRSIVRQSLHPAHCHQEYCNRGNEHAIRHQQPTPVACTTATTTKRTTSHDSSSHYFRTSIGRMTNPPCTCLSLPANVLVRVCNGRPSLHVSQRAPVHADMLAFQQIDINIDMTVEIPALDAD
ncbi:hypothetical protein Mapa_016688 [Marchantia paleacea]|nr:hypothetical protein Mapa_016688 [Marchantia paleacea]